MAFDKAKHEAMVAAAMKRFNAMTPEQQEAELRAQRRSWVAGEMGIGDDRAEAEYRNKLRSEGKL